MEIYQIYCHINDFWAKLVSVNCIFVEKNKSKNDMAKNENFLLNGRFCQCVKLKTFSCTPSYAHCRANMNQRIETSMNRHTICEGKNHKAAENCRNLIMQ